MNAERLLVHYDQIADAPDAIDRLRRFILDLAVRGKLVAQDPKDVPASELLKQIGQEKAQLLKARKIKSLAEPICIEDDEVPFRLPSGWLWTRLGNILTKLTDGTHHSPPNDSSGNFKYVTAKNIKDDGVLVDGITYVSRQVHDEIYSRCNPKRGDILYVKDGATTGVVTVNDLDEPFSLLSSVALLKLPTCLLNRLIVVFLRSPFFFDQMRGFMKGAAIPRVTLKRMAPALIPLPPLAEQRRIVAKVDELMTLCDRIESVRSNREAMRDRLSAACLGRITTPDAAMRSSDVQFALDALPALTTRPDQIKHLRCTIRKLAVQGKLVPHDANEIPAPFPIKDSDGNPEGRLQANIPENWRWVNVAEVASARLGKMLDKAKNRGRSYPYLRNTNVHWFDIRLDDLKTIALDDHEAEDYRLEKGDVLICEGGHGIGRTAVWPGGRPDLVFQKALHRVRPGPYLLPEFFAQCCFVYFETGIMQTYFTGVGIPHFTGRALAKLQFPLPPLAQQKRIVTKLAELMTLCDRLEASLSLQKHSRTRLLDALLHEAIESVDGGAAPVQTAA
jgi:type I restriction enzyme S subunit